MYYSTHEMPELEVRHLVAVLVDIATILIDGQAACTRRAIRIIEELRAQKNHSYDCVEQSGVSQIFFTVVVHICLCSISVGIYQLAKIG